MRTKSQHIIIWYENVKMQKSFAVSHNPNVPSQVIQTPEHRAVTFKGLPQGN
mgnify:CR=1 FL=1